MFKAKHNLKETEGNAARALPVDLRESYSDAVEQIQAALDDLNEKVSEQGRKIKTFTKQHPYQSLAIVFGAGSVLGLVMGKIMR